MASKATQSFATAVADTFPKGSKERAILVADRAHFFRVYEALVARERERVTLDPHARLESAGQTSPAVAPTPANVVELVTRATRGMS